VDVPGQRPARRFYERHGFVAVEHTDGAGNEEREPDVRFLWRPAGADPGSDPVHPADDEGHGQR
jgi:hypothetical protein